MDACLPQSGPDPSRVLNLADLARELGLLRARAARGTRAARVSLDQLASRVGEPRSTLHAYLAGKRLPPAEVLDRVVIALGAMPAEQREWAEAWFRVGACHEAARRVHGAPAAAAPPSDVSVPHQLPLRADRFVGREDELAAIDRALTGAALVAISGTAGVGKTALALQWAHQHAADYPDGQLYLDLRGFDPVRPVPPTEAAARLLRATGVAATAVPRALDERAAWFRSRVSDRRMIIVLDNARDTEHVRSLLPGTSTCAVLVTSRDSLGGLVVRDGARRVDLDPLGPLAAARLLGELVDVPLATAELTALAEQCARLPLALRVAAEFVQSRQRSVRELVDELDSGEHVLDLLEAGDDPRTALRSVFSWSYRMLGPAEARAFRLAGLDPGTDSTVEALAALTGAPLESTRRAVAVLTRAHLLQEIRPGRFGMHNLLRAYARELAADCDGALAGEAALSRLRAHYVHSTTVTLLASVDEPAGQTGTRSVAV